MAPSARAMVDKFPLGTWATLLLWSILVTACTTLQFDYAPPDSQTSASDYQRVFDVPIDQVWSATIKAIEEDEKLDLVLVERDMDLLVVEPNATGRSLLSAQYVDCGVIEGKPAVTAFHGRMGTEKLARLSAIALGQGLRSRGSKLRIQSIIRLFEEGENQSRVEIDSTYDMYVESGYEREYPSRTGGDRFSRTWSFTSGGDSAQAFGATIELITCRPTHNLEKRLLQNISEFLEVKS